MPRSIKLPGHRDHLGLSDSQMVGVDFIPYGMLSSGLYFIRDLVAGEVGANPGPDVG